MKTSPEWRLFEEAVARFLSALDSSAHVVHNAAIPDTDIGDLRQRDVWIETKVLSHFDVKILVSCKKWGRKLDVQDVDAFIGEWKSSGAHIGVIYSFSAFTEPALRKAKTKGISCCRLISGNTPELPESIVIPSYCFLPRGSVRASAIPEEIVDAPKTWGKCSLYPPAIRRRIGPSWI